MRAAMRAAMRAGMMAPRDGLPGAGDGAGGAGRAGYVRRAFDALAPRYDLANLVISAGLMPTWRRALLRRAAVAPGERVLDVGCGTGVMLPLLARAVGPGGVVVGVDFSPGMLDVARRRVSRRRVSGPRGPAGRLSAAGVSRGEVRLVRGDATHLPFPDAGFDITLNAFVLRNIVPLDAALGEMVRVTRPGGRILCLEVSRPDFTPWRWLFLAYWERALPLADGHLAGRRARHLRPYAYLSRSVRYLPDPAGVVAKLQAAGLSGVERVPLAGGAVAIYAGLRPKAPA